MNIRAELVEICDAFNGHDLNRIMSFFADDCVLEMPKGCEPYGPRFEGKHNVREAWLHVLRDYLSLGGCATSTAGSSLMDARAEAPALPKTSVYLPVEDLPPKPEKPAMTADERSKLKKELIAARDRQASRAAAQPIKP